MDILDLSNGALSWHGQQGGKTVLGRIDYPSELLHCRSLQGLAFEYSFREAKPVNQELGVTEKSWFLAPSVHLSVVLLADGSETVG